MNSLPFIDEAADRPHNHWVPASTGDSLEDYQVGLQYADDALDRALQSESGDLLAHVLMHMIQSLGFEPNDKSMEVAFLIRLAMYAKEGAQLHKDLKELPHGRSLSYFNSGVAEETALA